MTRVAIMSNSKRLSAKVIHTDVCKLLFVAVTVAAVLGSVVGNAAEQTITKVSQPGLITVISIGGTGLSFFNLRLSDFPGELLVVPKKLLGIEWRTTHYPENLNERVELCYFRPFNSEDNNCRWILPNASGVLHDFNDLPFGNGAGVTIKHRVGPGGAVIGHPVGSDAVTYRYSY
jgi:hypothetical protein